MTKYFQYGLYWYASIAMIGIVNTPDTFLSLALSTISMSYLYAIAFIPTSAFKSLIHD